ncbi:hypothetical protein AYO38_00535 [bacterium SCGC AG-212-C10]|nr:hypothetical protein AYO38_00535 [bacterium SCGC AG-212-C10]
MTGVTAGIRVLELGEGIAVAYCGKLFADYGADVLKVERPGGDPLRADPGAPGKGNADADPALFAFLNTSKQSVTVDLEHEESRRALTGLLANADIVVHPFAGAARNALGLDWATLHARGLIEVAVSPYGQTGPYRDFAAEPLTMTALAGWMFCMGDSDKPPLYPGGPYISYLAGSSAAAAALIALESRKAGGAGQLIDVSELEVGLTGIPFDTVRFSYSGYIRPRSNELYSDNPTAAIYPCADGYVQFQELRRLPEFLRLIGGDELASDPRLINADLRAQNRDVLKQAFVQFLATKQRWPLFEECSRRHIIISAVPDVSELPGLAPHRERSYFYTPETGILAGLNVPGQPIRFSDGDWASGPEPAIGAHDLPTIPAETAAPGSTAKSSALSHLKVVEIAQGWAGPTVGTLLADFGAEVVKVESIQRLDWWRGVAAGADDGMTHERAGFYNGINRNKAGVTLDLASARGRELLLELVRDADVFVENFTSHVIEQLGLTHDVLAAVNPRIISISMPAYGSTGPWADFPALGTTVESMCGVQSLTGYEGGPPRIQGSSWDPVIGMYGCFGVLAALHHRHATGVGQHIEVSHIEGGTHLVAGPLLEYQRTGVIPPRMGNSSLTIAPHGCYPAAGEDQWITIVARTDAQWEALKRVLGPGTALEEDRFATAASRLEHRHELDNAIGVLTVHRDKQELFLALQEAGVAAAPVLTPPELLADDHLVSREYFKPMDRAYVGTHFYPSRFFDMSATPSIFDRPAPTLGEHNTAVLTSWLGLTEGELETLTQDLVIGTTPRARG